MMDTKPSMLARVAELEILRAAWARVRGKGAAGGFDGMTVEEFASHAEDHLAALRADLLERRYVPQPLRQVRIPKDAEGREMRVLHLPAVRDKVAQEAARSVLEPLLEPLFLDCSYGYRPGKGPARAVARVTHYIMSLKRRWVATADIDDFFDSLDHRLLLDRLSAVVRDDAFVRLVELWLRMGTVDAHGRWHDVESGVAQGSVISPLLANFYLHPFDEYMVAKGIGLVRYADDFVLLCRDRADAERALLSATTFLEDTLALRLNPNPLPITTVDAGFNFLGITFQGQQRKLDQAKVNKKMSMLHALAEHGDVRRALRTLNEMVDGWRRYYGSLVGPDEVARLQEAAVRCLVRIVGHGFRTGHWATAGEAESALQTIETVTSLSADQRRRLVARIVRDARGEVRPVPPQAKAAAHPAPVAPPVTGKANGEAEPGITAARPAVGTPPTSSVEVAAPAPFPQPRAARGPKLSVHATDRPATAVRRAKRHHRRQLAQISELVINTPGAFLGKTSQRVVVRRDRRNVCEIPSFKLTGITVASRGISLSADLIDHCAQRDIPVLFVSPQGKVVATLSAPGSSKAATGLLQLRALSEPARAVDLARRFVAGKIRNQMNLLKYLHKYRKRADKVFADAFPAALKAMAERVAELRTVPATDLETARGLLFSIEGRAAQEYWALIKLALRDRVDFPGRRRQGATDLVNSLLNYGYAILESRVHLALLRAGLSPQISFLHALQPKGQPTLAYDLMEEFRPHAVDRAVLAMLGRREPLQADAQGLLTDTTRGRLIAQVYDRLATLVRFRRKELTLEEIIQHQAHLLVRHLKGEACYRPFAAKW
jgi:CRISPR-associated protein Cas1